MKPYLSILLFILLLPFLGFSSNQDSTLNSIFTKIYNQEFEQANIQLKLEEYKLNDFYSSVLHIDLLWWKYSSSRSKSDAKNLTNYLKSIEPEEPQNSKEKIRQLICKSYQLRYARKKYNLFDVIRLQSEIKQVLAELNRANLPISENQQKLFDLYMVMFQYFDKVNPFFIKSTADKRKPELEKMKQFSIDDNFIVKTMAQYFLGRIYQKVENKPEDGKFYFEILTQQFPKNKLFKEHLEDCKGRL